MFSKYSQFFIISGGLATIAGAVSQLLNLSYAPYIFAFGAVLLILNQLIVVVEDKDGDFRTKRLARLSLLASLLLGLAAYLMFTESNSWVVAVLMYALISIFLSFRGK